MRLILILILNLAISSVAFAQTDIVGEIVVDLVSKCEEEIKLLQAEAAKKQEGTLECSPHVTASAPLDNLVVNVGDILLPDSGETLSTCKALEDLKDMPLEPITVDLPGDAQPKKRVIVRFTTGLKTVPHKVNTNATFTAADGSSVSRDFTMNYDTRWQHLNVTKWDSIGAATNFLHEMTWGYQIDVLVEGKNKKRTGFSLFLDHPKFKGAMAQSEDGKLRRVATVENRNTGDVSAYKEGDMIYHVQNSHMNIIGGLKVSRDLYVKEFKNGGRFSYSVHAGGGVNIGASRAVEAKVEPVEKGGFWKSEVHKAEVQGFTAMAGQAVEYEKGKMAVTLSNTFQYSKIKQNYLDGGTVKYNLPHMALALTVSVNVFDTKNRDARREKKAAKRALAGGQ